MYLCHDPRYSKLPFSERDKIIAECEDLSITPSHVSRARRAVTVFSVFADQASRYLQHVSIPKHQLFEIVQSAYFALKSLKKYENSDSPELDEIIANWLGYKPDTVMHYRVAAGNYRQLRGLVPTNARMARRRGAEINYEMVIRKYARLHCKRNFRKLPRAEQIEELARQCALKPGTIYSILGHHGAYKQFKHP